ncbi:MAG: hypothetical protein HY424_00945 [Candidatus Levybacteria bacterium]|nr:hypothetical protein [Candidatus Levybacteria bacterium]
MVNDLRLKVPYLFTGLFAYLFIGLFIPLVRAETMFNKDYIIQTERIDTVAELAPNTNNNIQSDDKFNSEGNFKVKTGFEDRPSSPPFSVSLSSDFIDFGLLTPTNPISRTLTLSVNSFSVPGYSIVASENHPLETGFPQKIIADTTCDRGECNEEQSGEWTSPLTFGFGYRCDNIMETACDNSFSKSSTYKHFSNADRKEPFQVIVRGRSKDASVRLSYKVNISTSQPEGVYSNTITYIAIPNF